MFVEVKAEHQRPARFLQPLLNSNSSMEVGIHHYKCCKKPTTGTKWVRCDMGDNGQFDGDYSCPLNSCTKRKKVVELHVQEIVRLYGVPISFISNTNPRFTSKFQRSLQDAMGISLDLIFSFKPQMDGSTKRTIQVLKGMLKVCVLDFKWTWVRHLLLVDFTYNNSYQEVLKWHHIKHFMARSANLHCIGTTQVGEIQIFGSKIIKKTLENIETI